VVDDTATRDRAKWTISPPTAWDTSSFAGLRAIIREDKEARARSWQDAGFQAIVVHRVGEWIRCGGCPPLLRRPAKMLHKYMRGFVRNVEGFEIGSGARLGRRVRFHHQHGVVIDDHAVIGDDCVFRHGVTLAINPKADSPKSLLAAPQVGSRVTFGVGCIVLGGVRIGDGANIGPNAVVTTDVPPGASAVAQPARVLRIR
jgi:serine O-acetyltransferase